jgi:CHAT domain-containing protein/Tfp pilus assembly protein PilF
MSDRTSQSTEKSPRTRRRWFLGSCIAFLIACPSPASVIQENAPAVPSSGGTANPLSPKDEAEQIKEQVVSLYGKTRYTEALPLARREVELRRQIADSSELIKSLNRYGSILSEVGDYTGARPILEEAVATVEKTLGQNHPDLVVHLGDLGVLLVNLNEPAAAREVLERAVRIAEAVLPADDTGRATSLNNLAWFLTQRGDYASSRPLYEEALRIFEKQLGPDDPTVATAINNLASALDNQGDYAAARPLYQRALAIREKALGPDHPDVGQSLNNLAGMLAAQGEYAAARPLYERALGIFEQRFGAGHPLVASTLSNLADLFREQGDYAVASALLEHALKIQEKALGLEHPQVAFILSNLGLLLLEEGDYARARPLLERALALREKALGPEHPDLATSLNNLAGLYEEQGDADAALPLFERVLRIREKVRGPEHPEVATSLSNLASNLEERGEHAKARKLFERALAIDEHVLGPDHPDVGWDLVRLAHLLDNQGRYDEARPLYQRALAVCERALGPDHPDVAGLLNNFATSLVKKGDHAAALLLYERALQIYGKALGPDHPRVALSLNQRGMVRWHLGDPSAARSSVLEAARILDRHARSVLPSLSLAEQRAFLKSTLTKQVSALLSTCRDESGSLSEAYATSFRWKGLLLDAMRRQTVFARTEQDHPQLRPKLDRLRALRAQIAGWFHAAAATEREEWLRKNDELTHQKEALERELSAALGGEAADPTSGLGLDGFRSVLRSDEVFLDFYRYSFYQMGDYVEERYAAVVVPPGRPLKLVDLGQATTIDAAVAVWRTQVLADANAAAEWQALRDRLWQPLAASLPAGVRKVWLSPDGELARIPWHLLPESGSGGVGMILTQVNSPRELFLLRRGRPSEPERQVLLLLAGGVDFDAGSREGQKPGGEFVPLQGSKAEVKLLETQGGRQHFAVKLLAGSAASKAAVMTELPHATYAHLATHGFFRERKEIQGASPSGEAPQIESVRNPLVESGIALAGANLRDPSTQEAKGLLTAEELVGLDLSRCELLVLSACETGRGRAVTGQGVLGLRSAVMASGARSLVMSLWKVPDESTRRLMSLFYANLWEKKMSKAEALLAAQRALRGDPSHAYEKPIHWAAWVLVGEGW